MFSKYLGELLFVFEDKILSSPSVHRKATVMMGRDYEGDMRGRQKERQGGLRGAMDLSSLGLSGLLAQGWDQRHCSPSLCSPCHRYTSLHYCRSTRETYRDENQVQ